MDEITYPLLAKVQDIFTRHKYGYAGEIGAGSNSTRSIEKLCREHNIKMFSVDIRRERLMSSNDVLTSYCMKGEDFLSSFSGPIFFCYLDNYDWVDDWEHPHEPALKGCTKKESERIHLEQSKLLIKILTHPGYILFDDTGITNMTYLVPEQIMKDSSITFYGKGALAIPYLIKEGMCIVGYSPNSSHGGPSHQHDQILLELP